MTYNVFSGTLNPTHFTSLKPKFVRGYINFLRLSDCSRLYEQGREIDKRIYYVFKNSQTKIREG